MLGAHRAAQNPRKHVTTSGQPQIGCPTLDFPLVAQDDPALSSRPERGCCECHARHQTISAGTASYMISEFTYEPRIAYFSMEIALRCEIPTYTGGLGILAGDTIRSAADLGLPMVAVSLVSRAGHFRQEIDAHGRQIEHPDPWDPSSQARLLEAKVAVPIEGRLVWVSAWLYVLESHMGGRQPVLLLDTDLPECTRGPPDHALSLR